MTHASILPLLPDILLLALALLVLTADLWDEDGAAVFHLTWMGLAAIAALLAGSPVVQGVAAFSGYSATGGSQAWKLLFLLATLGTVFLSRPYFRQGGNARGPLAKSGAFFGLLLLCTQGMFALVSASDLLVFYLGLELATLPIYALAAFQPRDADSVEAGAKYVLMGGFSSALTLFGISFLYGAAGHLGFPELAAAAQAAPADPLLWGGVILLLGGLGFKLSMAPLHMWAPDVYQGAPTPVMAFLSVGSKTAAVAALAAVFLSPLDALRPDLTAFFAGAAALSMVAGNLGAMRQTDLRRFVAYSSVAQAGYMLVALVGDAGAARNALMYNLAAYGATSFALYFIMSVIGKEGPESLAGLKGLSRRHPGLAALLVLCMFSLAGVPPLAGFLGKFMLFSAAAAKGHYALVGVAVANAVVSFYYYMLVVKAAYIAEPIGYAAAVGADGRPVAAGAAGGAIVLRPMQTLSLWGLAALLLLLGLCPAASDWLAARSGP
ncbi:MAG TPA: NADH-quinone oxidoreductase subunit N [Fibrobacteria bacterium]|nr:NADH-quinone oxidoreductase subunit N [Fibrobacteria bacterium]